MEPLSAVDIAANRSARKYSHRDTLRRLAWSAAQPLFRWSPRPCFGWRRFLLRLFGAKVGREARFYGSSRVYMPWNLEIGDWSAVGEDVQLYNLGRVSLGSFVTISQRAHLCAGTHDYRKRTLPLLKPPISVADYAWVCADAFVGPGVVVHEGAVVGARAVVVRDVGAWDVVAGNPARVVKKRVLEE